MRNAPEKTTRIRIRRSRVADGECLQGWRDDEEEERGMLAETRRRRRKTVDSLSRQCLLYI